MNPDEPIGAQPRAAFFEHRIGGAGYAIRWFEWGDPDAERVLLCLHALNRNGRDFDFLGQALAGDFRVMCLDLPGRGDSDRLSDPNDYNHQTYLGVIDGLMDAAGLRGRRVDIVGTSLGGILGIMRAALRPDLVGRLVLNDVGTVTPADVFHKAAQSIMRDVRFRGFDQAVLTFKIMTSSCGPLTDPEWRAVSRHMVEPATEGGLTLRHDPRIGVRLLADAKSDLDLWSLYDRIAAPVLVIRGERSDVLSEENAVAMTLRGPRAELMTVPGTGHFPMLVKRGEIAAVRHFLL
jgi:pimeloyl-ACP methyl ester carboxylesterase